MRKAGLELPAYTRKLVPKDSIEVDEDYPSEPDEVRSA